MYSGSVLENTGTLDHLCICYLLALQCIASTDCLSVSLIYNIAKSTTPKTFSLSSSFVGEDDFTALTNEVVGTLVDDVRRTCFSVEITNDEIEEVDESFSVLLSVQVTGGEVETLNIDPSVAFVTIEDDDVMQNVTMPPPGWC